MPRLNGLVCKSIQPLHLLILILRTAQHGNGDKAWQHQRGCEYSVELAVTSPNPHLLCLKVLSEASPCPRSTEAMTLQDAAAAVLQGVRNLSSHCNAGRLKLGACRLEENGSECLHHFATTAANSYMSHSSPGSTSTILPLAMTSKSSWKLGKAHHIAGCWPQKRIQQP